MSTPSTTNPWEETITWQPAQPVEPDEPWLVCLDDGTVGQAFMEGLDWYWSDDIGLNYPITARVARMARLPIGPPLPFHASNKKQPTDDVSLPLIPASAVFAEIAAEIDRATTKFTTWPTDALHAVGVVAEEMGELQKEVMQLTYEPHKSSKEWVRKEAIQTAAMAIRFLMSLNRYAYEPCLQHSQSDPHRVPCALCDRGDGQLGHSDDCQRNIKS